jgi:hypothetical protein
MKSINVIYWTSAAILALLSIAAGYGYLTQIKMQEMMGHLGFPPFFRIELAVAKLVGAVCLIAPVGALERMDVRRIRYYLHFSSYRTYKYVRSIRNEPFPDTCAGAAFCIILLLPKARGMSP